MFERHIETLKYINKIQFTIRDELPFRIWSKFCSITLSIRYVYIVLPLFLRLLIGLPILIWGISPYLFFTAYAVWSYLLDLYFKYNYSYIQFSLKKFLITNLLKLCLFIIVYFYVSSYMGKNFTFICTTYAILMCIIATGYTMPLFDRILYGDNEAG